MKWRRTTSTGWRLEDENDTELAFVFWSGRGWWKAYVFYESGKIIRDVFFKDFDELEEAQLAIESAYR